MKDTRGHDAPGGRRILYEVIDYETHLMKRSLFALAAAVCLTGQYGPGSRSRFSANRYT